MEPFTEPKSVYEGDHNQWKDFVVSYPQNVSHESLPQWPRFPVERMKNRGGTREDFSETAKSSVPPTET